MKIKLATAYDKIDSLENLSWAIFFLRCVKAGFFPVTSFRPSLSHIQSNKAFQFMSTLLRRTFNGRGRRMSAVRDANTVAVQDGLYSHSRPGIEGTFPLILIINALRRFAV
jgi:hypothetical protein